MRAYPRVRAYPPSSARSCSSSISRYIGSGSISTENFTPTDAFSCSDTSRAEEKLQCSSLAIFSLHLNLPVSENSLCKIASNAYTMSPLLLLLLLLLLHAMNVRTSDFLLARCIRSRNASDLFFFFFFCFFFSPSVRPRADADADADAADAAIVDRRRRRLHRSPPTYITRESENCIAQSGVGR